VTKNIRWASSRWVSERRALRPDRESRRGNQAVQRQGEGEAILGREERIQLHHANALEWRLLHASDQRG
jgi:hypothetical protein